MTVGGVGAPANEEIGRPCVPSAHRRVSNLCPRGLSRTSSLAWWSRPSSWPPAATGSSATSLRCSPGGNPSMPTWGRRCPHFPGCLTTGVTPRRAWSEPSASSLPGPVLYWVSAVVVIAVLAVGAAVLVRMGRRHEPVNQRRRVGVETQARLAKTGDLRRLLTRKPKAGRFVLARWTGSRSLSTEGDLYRGRRGVRGAVGVFGPSQ